MIEPLLLTTARVSTFDGQRPLTGASGFFFEREGRLFLVTKHADWYQKNLPFVLSDVEVRPVRDYSVVTAVQRPKR